MKDFLDKDLRTAIVEPKKNVTEGYKDLFISIALEELLKNCYRGALKNSNRGHFIGTLEGL